MLGTYTAARIFSKCKRERKKTLIHFSMNVLQYNQYHQHHMKLGLLKKKCVETVLLHFYTVSSEIRLSKMCSLSISPSPLLIFWHLALQEQLLPECCIFLWFKTRISSVTPLLTLSDIQQFYSPVAKPPICCLSTLSMQTDFNKLKHP